MSFQDGCGTCWLTCLPRQNMHVTCTDMLINMWNYMYTYKSEFWLNNTPTHYHDALWGEMHVHCSRDTIIYTSLVPLI